jgi:hypothetical protein
MHPWLILIILFVNFACNKKEPEVELGNAVETPWSWKTPQTKSPNITGNVTTIGGFPGENSYVDGFGHYASFENPVGLTTEGVSLYVADGLGNTIRKIDIASGEVTTFAGASGLAGTVNGVGTDARFNYPWMISTDGTSLFVTESSETVRMINIATRNVTTLVGSPGISGTADGVGNAARFNGLSGITTDGTNLYVVDGGSHTIRKIVIATREVTTFAGTAGASGSVDGIGTTARFSSPGGIVTDGVFLYVADSANNTVRKIEISTRRVRTMAGDATLAGAHVDGTGRFGRFNDPYGMAIDGSHLYVVSANGCTLRKIVKATSVVTTIAGANLACSVTDGQGTSARFNYPLGITSDGSSLYSSEDNVIRKID